MNVITTFTERRREKQIKYERSVLRDLSINALKKQFRQHFGHLPTGSGISIHSGIEEACYDVAIEAYLLGAKLSKFGYWGESAEQVRSRSRKEEHHLTDTLYHFFLYLAEGEELKYNESLYPLCEQYVSSWWQEGFQKGEMRHKLRMN